MASSIARLTEAVGLDPDLAAERRYLDILEASTSSPVPSSSLIESQARRLSARWTDETKSSGKESATSFDQARGLLGPTGDSFVALLSHLGSDNALLALLSEQQPPNRDLDSPLSRSTPVRSQRVGAGGQASGQGSLQGSPADFSYASFGSSSVRARGHGPPKTPATPASETPEIRR